MNSTKSIEFKKRVKTKKRIGFEIEKREVWMDLRCVGFCSCIFFPQKDEETPKCSEALWRTERK